MRRKKFRGLLAGSIFGTFLGVYIKSLNVPPNEFPLVDYLKYGICGLLALGLLGLLLVDFLLAASPDAGGGGGYDSPSETDSKNNDLSSD